MYKGRVGCNRGTGKKAGLQEQPRHWGKAVKGEGYTHKGWEVGGKGWLGPRQAVGCVCKGREGRPGCGKEG